MIILDFSANTHKNNLEYAKKMIDEIKKIDTGKHEIVFKSQLFVKAGDNIPMDRMLFDILYRYAADLGYKMTASVFDKESLEFLLGYDIPFVKIANNRELDYLINLTPRGIMVIRSVSSYHKLYCAHENGADLFCVSKYPATYEDYNKQIPPSCRLNLISDHTTDWRIYNENKPDIYECHYKLEDSTGLDAGDFARTPSDLREIL